MRYGTDKGASYRPENYEETIKSILSYLIEKDIALELNSGGLRKGLDFLHPHEDIIKWYAEMGGKKFAAGSDAHFCEHVGFGFDRIEETLRRYGVTV